MSPRPLGCAPKFGEIQRKRICLKRSWYSDINILEHLLKHIVANIDTDLNWNGCKDLMIINSFINQNDLLLQLYLKFTKMLHQLVNFY